MPRLASKREGKDIVINKCLLGFSFWPMKKTGSRHGLYSRVYATNPWPIIERCVETGCTVKRKNAARAFLEQSKDFYNSASVAGVSAAKPLQLYYSFLNLAKAFILTRGQRLSLDKGQHGLSEKLDGTHELRNAYLDAYPTNNSQNVNMFDELFRAISGSALTGNTRFNLPVLLPQVIAGHRLWVDAANAKERFLTPCTIRLLENNISKEIWLNVNFLATDLTRFHLSHREVLNRSGLADKWQDVEQRDKNTICFQQKTPIPYTHRASDKIVDLVNTVKPFLWRTVRSSKPYREYYVYLAPDSEKEFVLPQLLSIYAIIYYLGSITRYRPHQFDKILLGEYGPFIESFLNDQPTQFLYLMASEFAQREVTKAALV